MKSISFYSSNNITVIFLLLVLMSGCGSSNQSDIIAKIQPIMFKDKQSLYDRLHPVGTATNLVVHSVRKTTTQSGDAVAIDYTINWKSLTTNNGFTKCRMLIDRQSEKIEVKVLETNGITNEHINSWLKLGGETVLKAALSAAIGKVFK